MFFWLWHGQSFKQFPITSTILSPLLIQGKGNISIGRHVYIHKFAWLGTYRQDDVEPDLTVSDYVCLGNFNEISCIRKVYIGRKVLTADNVYITDNLHSYKDVSRPVIEQGITCKNEVIIEEGVWIGRNVCVIGASIGKNSVIGANSVVTCDIPPYSVAVGIPARVIKQYNFESQEWESIREGKFNK